MDLTRYFSSRKRALPDTSDEDNSEFEGLAPAESSEERSESSASKSGKSKSEIKKAYKAKLSYRKQWEAKYPWVYCSDVSEGMFCELCQQRGNPPATARGAWTSRGVKDWNHATELLKLHSESSWHKDAVIYSRMAEQGRKQSVLEMHCSAAAKQLQERKERNQAILLKLLRSVYFLVKGHIPYTTNYTPLLSLQVANGDVILKRHINEGSLNAQYTSKFSTVMFIECIDSWVKKKLLDSLQSSSFFSILADECEDITTKEELTVCFRWIKNDKPEEHFVSMLHIKALDAATISEALVSYMKSNHLDFKKMVGQGYDGAATFSGCNSGVQKRMRVHAPHSLYIHCSCHRLQLASIHAAESIAEIKKVFTMMGNLWNFFHYSPKRAESLKEVQSALNLPELKITKPGDTRWLSHERCVRAIKKELPAILTTLQQLHEVSGDAEAYGLYLLLASQVGVASIMLLSEVLNSLAKMSASMQLKIADFSKLPTLLKITTDSLKSLKEENSEWLSEVKDTVSSLAEKYSITVRVGYGSRSHAAITDVSVFRTRVAIPYIDALLKNIDDRFSTNAVKILTAMSVLNPSLLPSKELLSTYGIAEITTLADFYGKPAELEFDGETFTSLPLLNRDDLLSEWTIFKRAFLQERDNVMKSKSLKKAPDLQEVLQEMKTSSAYMGIFPEMFKLIDIILAIPVGTATAERSFSEMKLTKTRLRNRLSDDNLARLLRISIEGPDLTDVNFHEILDIFKESNHHIVL